PELVAFPVQQENAGSVAIQQAGGFAGNQIEQRTEVALRVHPLRDGLNGGQALVQFGLWKRTHRIPKSTLSRGLCPQSRQGVYKVDGLPVVQSGESRVCR